MRCGCRDMETVPQVGVAVDEVFQTEGNALLEEEGRPVFIGGEGQNAGRLLHHFNIKYNDATNLHKTNTGASTPQYSLVSIY